ncbi:APC family permease [Arthrobacter sp. ISL-85]|uniref:APC family permease n=1 Tax=Arthrobacter sp. ISL-85 TaxID=2819115 RepID=UPI001BEC6E89|nr:APC family permease [Arthrobacter sp. ISL-85]MBT2568519.1 APC family permease [Arthrobacter sp. ISL-85]
MDSTTTQLATERAPQSGPHLTGKMGSLGLFFSVMAYNAPMVVVIGIIPIMVATGSGLGTPISFVVAGLILGCFAVGFTRMSKVMPKPGGFYSMITAGLGREVGLGSGLVALLGYFCVYAGTLPFGGIVLGELVHTTMNGPDLPWWVWAAVFWAGSAVLGYFNIELSAKFLTIFLFLEIIIIVGYDFFVFVNGGANHAGISLAPLLPTHWFDGSFGSGLLLALGMYGGFEVTVLFREEVKNPNRVIPRVTFAVIAVAMTIYAVSSLGFINALGIDKAVELAVADPTGSMTGTLVQFGGTVFSDVATILVNTSTFAVILAGHNITARYLFNLSADKIFPRKLSTVHRRHGSPYLASMATSAAGLLMNLIAAIVGLGPLDLYTAALGISSFVILAVIFIASIAVPLYLRKHGARHTAWSRVVFPVLGIIGLGTGLTLAAVNFASLVGGSTVLATALMALILGLFVLGFVMAIIYRRTKPATFSNIGRQ